MNPEQDRLDRLESERIEEMRSTLQRWINALGSSEPLLALISEVEGVGIEGVRNSWELSYQAEPGFEF